MQKIQGKFIYKPCPGLAPWWMIAGTTLSGRILLIGGFSKWDISALSDICKSIEFVDYLDFIGDKNNKLYESSKAFDVIIINTLNINAPLDLSHRHARCRKLFDRTPAIVVLESNPCHIKYFIRRPLSILKSVFFDVRSQHIKRYFVGKKITKYETLSDEDRPYESFPVSTYFTNKNSFLMIEKIKFFLLNTRYSRLFFNSQIWTLASDKIFLVQLIIEGVQKNKYLKWEGEQVRLIKVIFNSGKIILSLTSRAENKPEYILILPFDECSLQQRSNEKEAIEKLQSINEFSKYFVDEIITGTVDHLTYFAMKEFSGITVDVENKNLCLMIDDAFNVIKKLTKSVPDTNRYNQNKKILAISSEYISLILQRIPQHSSTIVRLGKSLPQNIDIPLIMFMHGDMKLENFVIDPQTNEVIGVIDLELAEFPGLPLIDLCFLITYRYQMVNQENFCQSFTRLVVNDLTTIERTYIRDYCHYLGINENQKKLCLAFFYLHQFAKRISFPIDNESVNKEFLAGCECIIDMLEKLSPID